MRVRRRGATRAAAPSRVRRGVLLAELLCALALAGLLAAACGLALGGARRAMAAAEARARAERAGREALEVAATLVRDADSVTVLGDTAVALRTRVAHGVVCGRDAASLTLPPPRSALHAWGQAPEAGDIVRVLVRDSLLGTRRWVESPIDSVMERAGESPCATGEFVATATAPRLRLVLSPGGAALGSAVVPGSVVRVSRPGRLALYRGGDGAWMLGWRRCAHGACGAVQPLAGPLRSAAQGGLRAAPGSDGLRLAVRVPGLEAAMEALVRRSDAGR